MRIIKDNVNENMSREAEGLIADLIRSNKLDVGFTPDRVWKRWKRRGDEIDVVALNDRNRIALFGEVKWSKRQVGGKVVDSLVKKSELVKEIQGHEKRNTIFGRSGFSRSL